jgi:radical SAM superfamily enzyme YgiQ (UPF0313 family)
VNMNKMYTHDTIYIPPHEEESAPLEVALGCSWRQCTFCDFARDDFTVLSPDQILENIKGLSQLYPRHERVFLLGENSFVLSARRLLEIFRQVNSHMASVTSFAMYARIDDVLAKTQEELSELKAAGLSALHIGVESGSDSILDARRKGVTSQQMLEAFRKLDIARIDYYITVILGLGGLQYSKLHAIETARLLNKTHPKNIWCLKLTLFEGTPLYKEWQRGDFRQMTPVEVLQEMILLLGNLTVRDCLFEDTTVLDQYTLQGNLPQQKQQLLDAAYYLLSQA